MKLVRLALILTIALLATSALGMPKFMIMFRDLYKIKPDGNIDKAECVACHTRMVPQMNPFGADLKKLVDKTPDKSMTPAILGKVELLDSDKDGFSNIAEIKADTLPGDPTSKPKAGAAKPKAKPGVKPKPAPHKK